MSARSSGTAQLLERDAEIDVIERALERSVGGSGGVVLVQAPAGVGSRSKTRMLICGRAASALIASSPGRLRASSGAATSAPRASPGTAPKRR
jgi:hypothetical protein